MQPIILNDIPFGVDSDRLMASLHVAAEAPIFDIATYGIVGDLFQVVPALTESLRGKLGGGSRRG